jgi:hypothetical protein
LSPPDFDFRRRILSTSKLIRKHIALERKRFWIWFDIPKTEVALQALAWWTATLSCFPERAILAFPRKSELDPKRLDLGINSAFARVRERLLIAEKSSRGP